MVLENEKVRSEKLYCVGYLKTLGKYILSQTVPASAWYNRYYEITKEKYDSFIQKRVPKPNLSIRCSIYLDVTMEGG